MNDLKSMETLSIEKEIFEIVDTQAREDIEILSQAVDAYITQNKETDAKYFDIDCYGVLSLKPEYRGGSSNASLAFSVSDNAAGNAGSKLTELPERITLPSIINEYAVTGFQEGMFYQNTRVKEIVLPNNITALPNYFCYQAENLTSVKNTTEITTIGENAFDASLVEKLFFPNLQYQ